MDVETHDIASGSGEHVVQFYERDAELLAAVGPYLSAAIHAGETVIAIATPEHLDAFAQLLERDGIDLARARAGGRYLPLDAREIKARIVRDGELDRDAFHEIVGGLMRAASRSGRAICAYGEIVAVLWQEGHVLTAIELERLWNELARRWTFSLYCAYPVTVADERERAGELRQVCDAHSTVLPAAGQTGRDAGHVGSLLVDCVRATYAPERESPGRARRLLVEMLERCGCGRAHVEAAALVLSELASNAVRHAGSHFSVEVTLENDTVRLAVRDAGPASDPPHEQLTVRAMHGLAIVQALSSRWGVEPVPGGKRVWAEMPA
ncbi:MAG TPA: MEDS domain-containing protein [Solirubrobacteraceae bacterium]|nr:MEDS domain-containing protein [Solirubrobacteraceae bacterium]